MALSKRERSIAIVASAAVAFLVVYQYGITPLLDSRAQLAAQRAVLERQLNEAHRTISRSVDARRRWKDFHAAGLVSDATATESNLLNTMRTWSQDAGLPLSSIRPDRASASHGLRELTFQATADGSMRSIAAFLYCVEMAHLPVRVRELQIAARSEGTDDLTMQVRISTLWEDTKAQRHVAALPRLEQEESP